jgi:NADH dehydrogenase/NADH:ubiquinone oxidoreductase subunit G
VTASATYVYCIVSSSHPPQTTNSASVPGGPPGTGPVRALEIRPGAYLMVSTAPLAQFGEEPLAAKLSDLEWVSRAAVAHDAVTLSFMRADAVVPMKLFTLFTSDERALAEVRAGWKRVAAVIKRLGKHEEWGVRLVFDDARAPKDDQTVSAASGRGYLLAKRQLHSATAKHSAAMRKIAGGVLKTLRPIARDVQQRAVTAPDEGRSRLLLDAAFLVPRAKADRFRKLVETRATKIAADGYALQLTGPWPPYSFVE